jgi:primary-amine oxidase
LHLESIVILLSIMASTAHPLDPITPSEIRQAVQILRDHFRKDRIRFKLVDIFEVPKAEVISYLENERLGESLPEAPARRARVYFHLEANPHLLNKARVNVTAGVVEAVESLPDVQGPVDFDEWEEVQNACNTHPKVIEEVKRLNLPPG